MHPDNDGPRRVNPGQTGNYVEGQFDQYHMGQAGADLQSQYDIDNQPEKEHQAADKLFCSH